MTSRMLTEKECLAKAIELEMRADLCVREAAKSDYLTMAEAWRDVARQAKWQDAPPYSVYVLNPAIVQSFSDLVEVSIIR